MNAFIDRLGWMLIHSVWEGVVIWLVLQMVLALLHKKSAQARYLASCVALSIMALLPWMTFGSIDLASRLEKTSPASIAVVTGSKGIVVSSLGPYSLEGTFRPVDSSPAPDLPADWRNVDRDLLPWFVAAWTLGVTVFACRLWMSWRSIRRLARMPLRALSARWQQRLQELCRLAGVRSVIRLGECADVVVPLVVGWLKPVILLPLGVLSQMPAGQVESILLHELAHVRRHDFAINVLQSVVETLFFFHPAVRSISGRIRVERERVCDDLSVTWCGDPVAYAEALTVFEEHRRQSLALAVNGEGDLLSRVRRIVLGVEPRQRTAHLFAVGGLLATAAYLASMFVAPLLVAEIMTDQERVAAIEALHPPGTDTMSNDRPSPQIPLSGTLTTDDGQPLPKSLVDRSSAPQIPSEAVLLSRYGNGSMTDTINFGGNSFYGNPLAGDVSLAIWAQGYAPLVLDHLEIKDGKIGPLALILKRGFPARLRLVTPDGKPLPGVTLSASTEAMTRYPNVAMPEVKTGADGVARIGNVDAKTVLTVQAAKPGWQTTDRVFGDWLPDQTVSWTLRPATLTSGTFVDAVTHQPLSNADILLASQSGAGAAAPSTYDPDSAPVLGHGDGHGHFKLDNLNPAYTYNIYVKAPGYPFTVLPIQPGDRGIRISGRILDPKGLLTEAYPPVQIRCDIFISPNPQYGTSYSLYQKFTKLSPVLPFSFGDLPLTTEATSPFSSQSAEFLVNGNWYKVPLDHDVDDFVIDLSKPPPTSESQSSLPSRSVEITLVTGKDRPVPTGSLNVLYYLGGNAVKNQSYLVQKSISLVNGKAIAQFPVPNELTPNPDGLVGYWFKEQSFDLSAGKNPLDQSTYDPDSAPVLGHGDGHGHFKLDNLNPAKSTCATSCLPIRPS
jgi:beta-lactamase regulating signal transducer with metallopeptidase domain